MERGEGGERREDPPAEVSPPERAPSPPGPGAGPSPEPVAIPGSGAQAGTRVANGPTRRDLLVRGSATALAACGLAAAAGTARFATWGATGGGARLAIGAPGEFKVGTLTWLREHDLFVLRDVAGWGAFSAKCTHLGCVVQRVSDGFVCPCHGARYGRNGEVLAGPARRSLPWYALALGADGRLWVDRERVVAPGPRPLEEAS